MSIPFSNLHIITFFYVFIIGPILIAIGSDYFPIKYKSFLIYLGIFVILYHLYHYFLALRSFKTENMHAEIAHESNVHYIKIFDSSPGFSPPILNVNSKDVVIWKNIGELEHTVTCDNGTFDSGILKPGETYTMQFNIPGQYSYHCKLHKGWMKGLIIVH